MAKEAAKTETTNEAAAQPVARMKVVRVGENNYVERWRKVLILQPVDVNDKLVADRTICSFDLLPDAKPGDVVELIIRKATA